MSVNTLHTTMRRQDYQQAYKDALLIDVLGNCMQQLSRAYSSTGDDAFYETLDIAQQARNLLQEDLQRLQQNAPCGNPYRTH